MDLLSLCGQKEKRYASHNLTGTKIRRHGTVPTVDHCPDLLDSTDSFPDHLEPAVADRLIELARSTDAEDTNELISALAHRHRDGSHWIITADQRELQRLRERRDRPLGYYTRARWAQPSNRQEGDRFRPREPAREAGMQPVQLCRPPHHIDIHHNRPNEPIIDQVGLLTAVAALVLETGVAGKDHGLDPVGDP
jgi:hypothetical protein